MKQFLLSLGRYHIACLLVCIYFYSWSANLFAQCVAPTNLQVENLTGTNNVVLSWGTVAAAASYQIRITNMVTNETSTPISVVAEPSAQQSFSIQGLIPDQDYLIRIRTVCCPQVTPTDPNCYSPYARTLAAAPEGHAGVINLERIVGSGSTTVQERGPLYICNLDLVKPVTISVKNLTTLITNSVTIPPDSCICIGANDIYKLTVTSGNNFKIDAPRTRLDCLGSSTKTDTDEQGFENMLFYPNPTTGNLTVEYLATPNENTKIVFFNNMGQQVANYALPPGESWQTVSYNLSHLPIGVYFCRIQSKNGLKVQKIILSNE